MWSNKTDSIYCLKLYQVLCDIIIISHLRFLSKQYCNTVVRSPQLREIKSTQKKSAPRDNRVSSSKVKLLVCPPSLYVKWVYYGFAREDFQFDGLELFEHSIQHQGQGIVIGWASWEQFYQHDVSVDWWGPNRVTWRRPGCADSSKVRRRGWTDDLPSHRNP